MSETDKTKLRDAMIKDIMDEFDFAQVHRVMQSLDWQWQYKGVPSLNEIMKSAEKLLIDAYNKTTTVSCGGFTAKMENGSLSLSFVLETMTTFTEDYLNED
jgi:hypothetical protein